MDLFRKERWSVTARPTKRLWRQEIRMVTEKRLKRMRIGTNENGTCAEGRYSRRVVGHGIRAGPDG